MPHNQPGALEPFLPDPASETLVRTPLAITAAGAAEGVVLHISRWLCGEPTSRQALTSSAEEHLVSFCLRTTRFELRSGAAAAFDGVMRAGMFHLTGPGRQIAASFGAPCDFLHLHIPTVLLLARQEGMGGRAETLNGLDGRTLSDPLVDQLVRLLTSEGARTDVIYATAITQTLLTRILHLANTSMPAGALAKWRLRRVEALVSSRLAEPPTLSEMAAAAGLSRMHFAAQFRAATGSSPHEYLLGRRIEAAKTLLAETQTSLAEVALSVGFLGQAHFTTVFKRLVGATPARWRRTCRENPEVLVELDSPDRDFSTSFLEGVRP